MAVETVAAVTLPNQCQALTGKELSEAMAVSDRWAYPGEQDGWITSHNSIRHDMEAIRAGMETTLKQVQGGKPMEPWQPANLAKYFPMFYEYVHDHHDHEEEVFFPFLSSRMTVPPKMSTEHAGLMTALDKCLELAKSMKATGNAEQDAAQVQAFLVAFEALETPMLEHLKEEEEVALPNMRKYFTHKEVQPCIEKVVAEMKMQDHAHLLNHMSSVEEKKSFMTDVAGIPGFAQRFILLPTCKKYAKKWHRLLEELKAGQQVPKKRRGLFRWF